jgi:hypothetical protein
MLIFWAVSKGNNKTNPLSTTLAWMMFRITHVSTYNHREIIIENGSIRAIGLSSTNIYKKKDKFNTLSSNRIF